MSSLMVSTVANGGEPLCAVSADVGLLTSVGPHVHLQVSSFCEDLAAAFHGANEWVLSLMKAF